MQAGTERARLVVLGAAAAFKGRGASSDPPRGTPGGGSLPAPPGRRWGTGSGGRRGAPSEGGGAGASGTRQSAFPKGNSLQSKRGRWNRFRGRSRPSICRLSKLMA
jgi:hypothetical protein